MTYRGVVRNGIVILEDGSGLHNGTVVDVRPVGRQTKNSRSPRRAEVPSPVGRTARKAKTKKALARKTLPNPFLEALGIWKDRPDWKGKTTLQIAAELRRKAMRRFGI